MNPKLERYRAAQLNQDIGGNEMNSKSVAIFTGVGVDTLMCRVDENGEKLIDWLNENGMFASGLSIQIVYGDIEDFTN